MDDSLNGWGTGSCFYWKWGKETPEGQEYLLERWATVLKQLYLWRNVVFHTTSFFGWAEQNYCNWKMWAINGWGTEGRLLGRYFFRIKGLLPPISLQHETKVSVITSITPLSEHSTLTSQTQQRTVTTKQPLQVFCFLLENWNNHNQVSYTFQQPGCWEDEQEFWNNCTCREMLYSIQQENF